MYHRAIKFYFFIFIALICSVASVTNADQNNKGATWILLDSAPEIPDWKTKALELTISDTLSTIKKVTLMDLNKSEIKCQPSEKDCLLLLAKEKKIDIVILGKVTPNELQLSIYDPKSHALVNTSQISFHENLNLQGFRHSIFQLVKPFTQIGGLLDTLAPASSQPAAFFLVGIFTALFIYILGKMSIEIFKKITFSRMKINVFIVTLFLFFLTAGGLGIFQAVQYHPEYIKRMNVAEEKFEKFKQQQGRKHGHK